MFKMRDRGWIAVDIQEEGIRAGYLRFITALSSCLGGFHGDETRDDGRPFRIHPIKVDQILWFYGIRDENSLIAGLFHDSPEAIGLKLLEDIGSYGSEVVEIVRILTRTKGQDFGDYCRGILLNVKAVQIKLADRIHNLRNMTKRIGTGKKFTMKRLRDQVEETEKYIIPMAKDAILFYPANAKIIGRMLAEIIKDVQMAKLIIE